MKNLYESPVPEEMELSTMDIMLFSANVKSDDAGEDIEWDLL